MKRLLIIATAVASLAACSSSSEYNASPPASGSGVTPSHSGTPAIYAPIFGVLASIFVQPERNSCSGCSGATRIIPA
jgi:hypothetical protein